MQKCYCAILALQMILCLIEPARAQQAPASPPPAAPIPAPMVVSLKLLVLEGQGAVNDIARHLGVPSVVEVRDENDLPVEGVSVTFRLPPDGAGGHFAGGVMSKTVRTNMQGQAGSTSFVPNDQAGVFQIQVTAILNNRMGHTVISQTNSPNELLTRAPEKKKKSHWWIYVAAGAAAAAVIGIIAATRGGSSSSSKNGTVTVVPGPVTIGH